MTAVKKQLNSASKLYLNSKDLHIPKKFNNIEVFRAKACRTIKISKHKSWRSYVSKINHKTLIKKVLDMIRKIPGKNKSPSYTH